MFTLAACGLQHGALPHILKIVWGNNLSPGLSIAIPFENTENWDALTPIALVQGCPVLARSIWFLDIAGIRIFIAGKKCYVFLSRRCMASGISRGFSVQPTTGASTKKYRNQYAVPIRLNNIHIPSAGMAPQYINKKKSPTKNQVNCFQIGL